MYCRGVSESVVTLPSRLDMAGEWMQFCEEVSWGPSMPLVRGQIIGYDATLMVFEFTMIDKAVTAVVECQRCWGTRPVAARKNRPIRVAAA